MNVLKTKELIRMTTKQLRIPVYYFNRTQEVTLYNSNILAAFYENLWKSIKNKQGSPLYYGS